MSRGIAGLAERHRVLALDNDLDAPWLARFAHQRRYQCGALKTKEKGL
jgi:hypothetical protein